MKTMDLSQFKAFYPDAAPRDGVSTLVDGKRKYTRKAERRSFVDARKTKAAAELIAQLPGPGESIHAVMSGSFDAWHIVPAVLRLAEPRTIARLDIATLGFSSATLANLLESLDAGHIGRLGFFVASHFFKSHSNIGKGYERGLWEQAHRELTKRGSIVAACRSHAKLLLMEISDGTPLTVESSANLRSCQNAEQFCLTNDAELLEFHRAWLGEITKEANECREAD